MPPPPPPQKHSIPPAVWTAVIALLAATTGYVGRLAQTESPTPSAPRSMSQPATTPPLGKPDMTPTTDEGVIACRTLEARLNPLIEQLQLRARVIETRQCIGEKEQRQMAARFIELAAGKSGGTRRTWFEDHSTGWQQCPLDLQAVESRTRLSETADSALRPTGR